MNGSAISRWRRLLGPLVSVLLVTVGADVTSGKGDKDLPTGDIVRFLEQATWGPTPALIDPSHV